VYHDKKTETCDACGYSETNGAVAHLGERLHGMQEVVGSIPISSTTDIECGRGFNK
jgi:hypothetical protein